MKPDLGYLTDNMNVYNVTHYSDSGATMKQTSSTTKKKRKKKKPMCFFLQSFPKTENKLYNI